MKLKSLIAGMGLLAVPVLATALNRTPDAPHIDVKGHAERKVQPDRFAIDLHIEAVDMKPALARTRVEKHMADVLAGFKAHHALPESIDASALSITPKQTMKNDEQVFAGTEVSRTAQATFTSIDDLRAFIDGVDASEELQITSTSVTRSDLDAVNEALRQEAMADSRAVAASLAKSYGVVLGGLYSASNVAPDYDFYSRDARKGSVVVTASRLPSIDLQVGSIKVEQNIYATFLLGVPK